MTRRRPLASGRRSKFEDKIAAVFDDLGVEYEYEPDQFEYDEPLRKNRASCAECGGTDLYRTGWYTPDFRLTNGLYVETKGRFTAADRRKMLAVIEAHPDDRFVMLFMRDNKIHKNSKTMYSDWCMEHDVDFAIGEPKRTWYEDTIA
jgi:hypothetical protein